MVVTDRTADRVYGASDEPRVGVPPVPFLAGARVNQNLSGDQQLPYYHVNVPFAGLNDC